MKTKEKFNKLQIKCSKFGGVVEVLEEIKKIETIDELKDYIKMKEREFWDKSTPVAVDLCETLIKMGEEYVEGEKIIK